MKQLLTITMMFILSSAFAGHGHMNHSILNVSVKNKTNLNIFIDNVAYQSNGYLQKRGICEGNHLVKVVGFERNPYGCGTVKRVLYKGYVNVPACSEVSLVVSHHGGARTFINPRHTPPPPPMNGPGHGHGHHGNPYPDYNHGDGSCGNDIYPTGGYNYGMNDYQFDQLMNTLDNTSFDDTRLEIAKTSVRGNQMTSAQITEVMGKFSFESTKLDFAKYAYRFVVDPENYYVVNNAFTFDSSRRKLSEYINRA